VKAALISFVLLPLLLIALITRTLGFRTLYALAASVLGEVLGLFLYASYKQVPLRPGTSLKVFLSSRRLGC